MPRTPDGSAVPAGAAVPAGGGSPSRAVRLTAGLVLVLAVLAAGWRLPGELRGQAHRADTLAALPRDQGVPLLALGPQRTKFLLYVRSVVPAGASVRLVLPARPPRDRFDQLPPGSSPGVCDLRSTVYFWLVYVLAPRAAVCTADAPWSLYYGVTPTSLPAGARVYRFAPGLILVRR